VKKPAPAKSSIASAEELDRERPLSRLAVHRGGEIALQQRVRLREDAGRNTEPIASDEQLYARSTRAGQRNRAGPIDTRAELPLAVEISRSRRALCQCAQLTIDGRYEHRTGPNAAQRVRLSLAKAHSPPRRQNTRTPPVVIGHGRRRHVDWFREPHPAEPFESIRKDLRLGLELHFVIDVLPGTAATRTKYRADGIRAPGSGREQGYDSTVCETRALGTDFDADAIPGRGEGNEHHAPIVGPADSVSTGGEGVDLELDLEARLATVVLFGRLSLPSSGPRSATHTNPFIRECARRFPRAARAFRTMGRNA